MTRKSSLLALYSQDVAEPTLNLTALIDVVFVVLIMFIVIAPLLNSDTISLAQGPAHSAQPPTEAAQGPLRIAVDAQNRIFFNQRPVTLSQLKKVLAHLHGKWPETHPQLWHDQKASFGTYQSIKNVVELAGFSELEIILLPGE